VYTIIFNDIYPVLWIVWLFSAMFCGTCFVYDNRDIMFSYDNHLFILNMHLTHVQSFTSVLDFFYQYMHNKYITNCFWTCLFKFWIILLALRHNKIELAIFTSPFYTQQKEPYFGALLNLQIIHQVTWPTRDLCQMP